MSVLFWRLYWTQALNKEQCLNVVDADAAAASVCSSETASNALRQTVTASLASLQRSKMTPSRRSTCSASSIKWAVGRREISVAFAYGTLNLSSYQFATQRSEAHMLWYCLSVTLANHDWMVQDIEIGLCFAPQDRTMSLVSGHQISQCRI